MHPNWKFQCLLTKISFLGGLDKIDIMIAMQIYKLTGHFLYELFGNDNPEMECLKKFRLLNNRQKAYISGKIDFELEMMSHEQDSENMLDVLVLTGNMEDGMVLDSANEERILLSRIY